MLCRACGYALWNLPEPRCPECGLAFDARSYRFTQSTVACACPRCGGVVERKSPRELSHSGASAEQDTVTCPGCAHVIPLAGAPVTPLTADPDDALAVAGLPWEDKDAHGFWRAWWLTIRLAIVAPRRLGADLLPGNHQHEAFGFYIFTIGLACLAQGSGFGLVAALLSGSIDSLFVGPSVGIAVAVMAGAFAWLVLLVLVMGPTHTLLLASGPTRRGWVGTANAISYSHGLFIFAGIPVVGFCLIPLIGLWVLVAQSFAIAGAQQVSVARAAICTFLVAGALVAGLLFLVMLG